MTADPDHRFIYHDDENETHIKEAVYACYNQRRGCPCRGVAVHRKPYMQGPSSISRQTKERSGRPWRSWAMNQFSGQQSMTQNSRRGNHSASVGVGGLPESILSGDDTGNQPVLQLKQYINTVITGQNEDEILQAIKTMARTGWQRIYRTLLRSRTRFWIISMKRTAVCSLEKRAGM